MNPDYEKTPIPDTLEQTVTQAYQKAALSQRKKRLRTAGIAVAACAAMVLAVNIPPVASALQQVPVLGTLVRVLQIGDGGTPTDGTTALGDIGASNDSVRVSFQTTSSVVDTAPAYTVTHAQAPNRITVTLNGVRGFDLSTLESSLANMPQVKGYYRDILLDDSAIRFTIVLQEGTQYAVSEYKDPGYVDLSFTADAQTPPAQTLYFLRSNSMPQGEALALLTEMYQGQGANTSPTLQDDQYAVVIGSFTSKAEAEAFYTQLGNPPEFWVDSCATDSMPA